MKNFFISDTHFGHYNIIKLCNRPFKTAEEMDETLIKNWNSTVTNKDTVYILGDVAFGKGAKRPYDYLKELNGKKILILGNHDYDISKHKGEYLNSNVLQGIYDYLEIKENFNNTNIKVVLSHYPMVEWNGMFRGSIHLFGHIHNNTTNNTYKIVRDIENAYNVGADIIDFTPKTLVEIINCNKRFNKV